MLLLNEKQEIIERTIKKPRKRKNDLNLQKIDQDSLKMGEKCKFREDLSKFGLNIFFKINILVSSLNFLFYN